jgi:N-acetylneuraminate synthase/sialic acid synthase
MSRTLTIGTTRIHDDGDCYVIAEIGHNHQGSVEKAKEMFRVAKDCGVDAVKLQKRSNRTLYTRAMYESPYDNENSFGPTYGAHREALEFGWDQYVELKRYAAEIGITFFATAFDAESADFLAKLDVPAYKIASGDLNNVPLLAHVARMGKPVIVSTGGGSIDDVQRAHDTVTAINPQLCLLQCTASYPAEPEDMNLRVITTFRDRFPNAVIGLSDHQNGIALADAAYVLGARVIEKHFTLNRASKGTDHAYSLEREGLRKIVRDLRRVRAALGSGVKAPLAVEKKPLFKMGKKLVAARRLAAGHVLSAADVAIKSPNDGLPPYELPSVLGRALRRDLAEDDSIALEDLI